jgi:REP-associated tyrosine transposase
MKVRDTTPKPPRPRKRRPLKRPKQLALPVRTHGGARRGSGRKRVAPRPRVVHRTRPRLDCNHPVHVTIRIRAGLPRLRTRIPMRAITGVLIAARGRFALRVIQFAVLADHLHFIVEAADRTSLTRGMRGLGTRLAIHLNRALDRTGKLFDDRYHARAMKNPLEVRNGLVYVINNFRKHEQQAGRKIAARWIDPYSSGPRFDGWRDHDDDRDGTRVVALELGTLPPRTWLLTKGWRRHGLIGIDEVPGPRPTKPS